MVAACLHFRNVSSAFLLLAAAGGIVACSGSPGTLNGALPATGARHQTNPSTPIAHVIVVVQENRSFDDFFATFPNANGTKYGFAEPMPTPVAKLCAQRKGQPVIRKRTKVALTEVTLTGKGFKNDFGWDNDLAHNYKAGYLLGCHLRRYASKPSASNPCAMDVFDVTKFGPNGEGPQTTCTYTYQYVNPSDIKPYWEMAQQYVLADNAFQTQGSESFTAHQALIAGGTAINGYQSIIDDPTGFPWGCDANSDATVPVITTSGQQEQGPFPCLTYPNGTIRDLLDAKNVSWKYCMREQSLQVESTKEAGDSRYSRSAFDTCDQNRFDIATNAGTTKVTNTSDLQIFKDIRNGKLPAVSWVMPPDGANSDHPDEKNKNGPIDTGPSWVASIVNAVGEEQVLEEQRCRRALGRLGWLLRPRSCR